MCHFFRFCEKSVVPTRKVRCFPNNEPWINRDIKVILKREKITFIAGDNENAQIQRELRRELQRVKDHYRKGLRESYSRVILKRFGQG